MNEELNQYNGQNAASMPENSENKPIWAALACFILSLVNILACCCCTYASVPVSLAFGIMSLVKKWRGKGFAIAGIAISTVTILFVLISNVALREESEDLKKLYSDPAKYIQMYEETGEIPTEFEKYTDPKYDSFWTSMGCRNFEEFYAIFLENLGAMTGNRLTVNNSGSDTQDPTEPTTRPSNYGEEPVKI